MKKILIIILLLTGIGFAQSNIKTKWLSSLGDSSYRYTSIGEWVEILAIDSADADTVNVYYPSVGTGEALVGTIKEVSTGDFVSEITPPTGVNGAYYVIWLPYPRAIDFFLESTGGAAEMYIRVVNKP